MKSDNLTLRKSIVTVLEYEYRVGNFGLHITEYTTDIINSEAKRLVKRDLDILSERAYTLCKSNRRPEIKSFETLDKAIDYAFNSFDEIYIIYDGMIYLPFEVEDRVELQAI